MNRSLLCLFVVVSACRPPRVVPPPDYGFSGTTDASADSAADSAALQQAVQEMKDNFQRVSFDFDSAALNGESHAALLANAAILIRHAQITVEIQGHADERGSTDYNLALGQRRAQAVRSALLANGVPGSRVTVISYGEERPLSENASELSWAQNRRAEFRVLSGAEVAEGTTR